MVEGVGRVRLDAVFSDYRDDGLVVFVFQDKHTSFVTTDGAPEARDGDAVVAALGFTTSGGDGDAAVACRGIPVFSGDDCAADSADSGAAGATDGNAMLACGDLAEVSGNDFAILSTEMSLVCSPMMSAFSAAVIEVRQPVMILLSQSLVISAP